MREKELFIEANQMFESVFALIKDEQWGEMVPSAPDWTVHELVEHVIQNNLATAAILSGQASEENIESDDDITVTWSRSAQLAESAAAKVGDGAEKIQGPLGEMTKNSFLRLMTVDRTVHTWDLAKAIDEDTTLNPEVAKAAYEWVQLFATTLYKAGEFGEAISVAGDATDQERLLTMTGREPS
ncbi:MAG: TIGR03086 family metal-binding protein [Candidatus Saccharibacteria bacterium]